MLSSVIVHSMYVSRRRRAMIVLSHSALVTPNAHTNFKHVLKFRGRGVRCLHAAFSLGWLLPPVNISFSSAAQHARSESWIDHICIRLQMSVR